MKASVKDHLCQKGWFLLASVILLVSSLTGVKSEHLSYVGTSAVENAAHNSLV